MRDQLVHEIKHLTARLDAIIREQAGAKLFSRLEAIRGLFTRHRGRRDSGDSLIDYLSVAEAYQIAHALSLYFQLVNLCEERQRERRLRANPEPRMSLRRMFRELKATGVTPRCLQRTLDKLEVQPVLTAHPTEAKRRAVLNQVWRVACDISNPDEALEALWQTEEIRESRVGPLQEVESTVYYFDRAIFETVANFYERFDAHLREFYPSVNRNRPFLTFASWVGGDRDGNPFVTTEVSATTARWHACVARAFYERACARLVEEITHASSRRIRSERPGAVEGLQPFQPYEGLREQLANLRRRLARGQGEAREIIQTLANVQSALRGQKAKRAAQGRIQRLLTQAQAFGVHLAELDFRDHTNKLDSAQGEVLEEFRAMREIQRAHGTEACNRFVLSMTRSAQDMLHLLKLTTRARVTAVDLVPLFETIEDLEHAPDILLRLWSNPAYRAHLRGRNDLQEVMVGYSDSNKDGGYLAANWFLYKAQKEIARRADRAGVNLRFFHGKGGTIDRGGGASYRSLRAQPHAAHGARLRITEQGEMISLKYSNPVIAQRNLEQLTAAVLGGQCVRQPVNRRLGTWEATMERIGRLSLVFYQDLVYGTPEFNEYFWEATPIDLVEHLRLGSRPARRQASRDIRQLRAIPWVFAWTQSRHLLSAWYGVGHALNVFANETNAGGLRLLREMYQQWPFFQVLLDNAEVSLAKADLGIARRYAGLVKSERVRKNIFPRIEAEYHMSVRMVLAVNGRAKLLQNQSTLARSIQNRNPYVDPLSLLQIRFLRAWRRTPEQKRTEPLRRLLALTVSGIASGMKSTG